MSVQYNPGIVTDSLVLCYDAGDKISYSGSIHGGTIATWKDLSGNTLDGQITGSSSSNPTFDTGSGGSLVFDGSNDLIRPTANALFNIREQITVTAWVKAAGSGHRRIVNKEEDNSTNDRPWQLNWTAGNKLQVGFNDYDLNVENTTTLSTGTWYYVGFTYDKDGGGSDELKFYVNGEVDGTGNYSTILDSTEKAPGIGAGYIYNASPDSPFEGNIANVYIYSKELSGNEMLQNFNTQRSRFGV